MGGQEHEPFPVRFFLDGTARQHGGKRQSGTQGLGQGQDVRCHPIALEGEHMPRPADTGLGLVQDQQHPALVALLAQCSEIAHRQFDDAA